ncbi:MAG: PfkB family carbohydrate kinase [Chloroflexi bacterium]|nr:PfkB family carbohydrate kinase [Chloroflexota bacterium]
MPSPIDVLTIGHLTVDLVPGGRMLGGTVAYAAPTYAAFGHRVGVLTSAACNEPLLEHLLPHAELVSLPAQNSLTYENVYSAAGRQQFVRATAKPLRYDHVPIGWTNPPYLHMGPLAAEIDPRELANRFPNAIKMLTLQGMLRRWDADGLVKFRRWFDADALRQIELVVYSEEDIHPFPQLTDEMRRVCQHLVVTNGRDGGVHYHAGGAMRYASLEVVAHDLTGAGDVFAAALLGSLRRLAGDVSAAVRLAGRLAAYSVTRASLGSAPTSEEIERELNREPA